ASGRGMSGRKARCPRRWQLRRHSAPCCEDGGRAAQTRRNRNASSRAPAPQRRKPPGHTGAPNRAPPSRRAAPAMPFSLGPQSLAFLTPNIAGSKPGRSGAPPDKRPQKISTKKHFLPPFFHFYTLAKAKPIGHA